jgi:uncharacterized protein (DUF1330 family)
MGGTMAAYVVVNVTITDPERYAEYIRAVPATIAAYGGRFLARGGRAELLEGAWTPRRVVVIEFESMARAREWYRSQEYSAPKAVRHSAAVTDMILVDGIPPGGPARP